MTNHRRSPSSPHTTRRTSPHRHLATHFIVLSALIALSGCGSDSGGAEVARTAPPSSAPTAPTTSALPPVEAPGDGAPDEYCGQFESFASWSAKQFAAVTAEAATTDFTVRDPYFGEQLQRIESMQEVAPPELKDALEEYREFTKLYLAHDLPGAANRMQSAGPSILAINAYGRDECGIDPTLAPGG